MLGYLLADALFEMLLLIWSTLLSYVVLYIGKGIRLHFLNDIRRFVLLYIL